MEHYTEVSGYNMEEYITAFDLVIDFVEKGHRRFVKTRIFRQLKSLARDYPIEVEDAIRNAFEEYHVFEEAMTDDLMTKEFLLTRMLFPPTDN